MDVTQIKREIIAIEDRGAYNEAIELLFEKWNADKDDPQLCALFLGECVWTCGYQHDIECDFPDLPVNYNFKDRMIDALDYSIERFQDDFMFQLRIGFLLLLEGYWFCSDRFAFKEINQVYTNMIRRAHELKPSSKVAEYLFRVESTNCHDLSAHEREAIKQELDGYNLEETVDDMSFRRFFVE